MMQTTPDARPALAFVDLETTGAVPGSDRITEIGVVLVDGEQVREWSSLVNPQRRIPGHIVQMTGISDAMVSDAPLFAQVAGELAGLLRGRLFIAHNARFDYGFLKHEFELLGMAFQHPALCTVKLSRKLFPQYPRHNLDSLIERHGLAAGGRHRALADARLIHQFWQMALRRFAAAELQAVVDKLVHGSGLPAHIDPMLLQTLPEAPGVYLFYGDDGLPLYIGKSDNLRRGVLAHFAPGAGNSKKMNLAARLQRIDWRECAGELAAVLAEAKLLKQYQPPLNRRPVKRGDWCGWYLKQEGAQLWPELKAAGDADFFAQPVYGLYRDRNAARRALRALAAEQRLCLALLRLEKNQEGRACSAHQSGSCQGACLGWERPLAHATRLQAAMTRLQASAWPFPAAIALIEGADWHVVDRWCHLGTVANRQQAEECVAGAPRHFDHALYLALSKAVKQSKLVLLGNGRERPEVGLASGSGSAADDV